MLTCTDCFWGLANQLKASSRFYAAQTYFRRAAWDFITVTHWALLLSSSANTCCLVPTRASPSMKTLGCTFCSFCKPCSWLSLQRLQSSLSLPWRVNLLLIFTSPVPFHACFLLLHARDLKRFSFLPLHAVFSLDWGTCRFPIHSSGLSHLLFRLFWLHLPQLQFSCPFHIRVSVWPQFPFLFSCLLA